MDANCKGRRVFFVVLGGKFWAQGYYLGRDVEIVLKAEAKIEDELGRWLKVQLCGTPDAGLREWGLRSRRLFISLRMIPRDQHLRDKELFYTGEGGGPGVGMEEQLPPPAEWPPSEFGGTGRRGRIGRGDGFWAQLCLPLLPGISPWTGESCLTLCREQTKARKKKAEKPKRGRRRPRTRYACWRC